MRGGGQGGAPLVGAPAAAAFASLRSGFRHLEEETSSGLAFTPDVDASGANGRHAACCASALADASEAGPLLQQDARPYFQRLAVLDRTPLSRAPPEVILYVPGFNASVKDEVCAIGQLLCLGDFPPSVKAFTFSWPGGRELTYFTALGYARHPRCQADFAAFVASLIDAGVREFHVLCHSVGAHVFFSALHLLTPMLATCDQQSRRRRGERGQLPPNAPRARFATVMMMSPDYPLRSFIHKDFSLLRRLCATITLYCDTADRALFYSETFNREAALGKNPFLLVREKQGNGQPAGGPYSSSKATAPCYRVTDSGMGSSSETAPSRNGGSGASANGGSGHGSPASEGAEARRIDETPAELGAGQTTPELRSTQPPSVLTWVATLGEWSAQVGVSVASGVVAVPDLMQSAFSGRGSSTGAKALEGDLHSRVRHDGDPLDMDVIDTSWMDSNVHALRHNYFNVNRWMLDDIRDIVISKRRAHLRSGGLTHRRGNVWSFVGAPKYIVNP